MNESFENKLKDVLNQIKLVVDKQDLCINDLLLKEGYDVQS